MRAIYTLTMILCLHIGMGNAQEYVFGVKGGFNTNKIGDINSRGGSIQVGKADEVFSPNKEIDILFGAYFAAEFGIFFIRPEINYVSLKNNYAFPKRKSNWSTSKIEVPLLLGIKVFDPISIYVGPSLNFWDRTLVQWELNKYHHLAEVAS